MRPINIQKELELTAQTLAGNQISPVLLAILEDFQKADISYCFWKSSRGVYSALAGESDLDLLIARKDQHRCKTILHKCGLKLFPSVPARDDPAVLSFLGHDDLIGQLAHVHLHFRLVSGERLLKNYHLPWEDAVLARSIQHPAFPIRILDPASEAFLLVIRSCLELRRRDPVTWRHWTSTTRKFSLDRTALTSRLDEDMLRELAAGLTNDHFAAVVVEAFYDKKPLEDQWVLRRHIEEFLAPYRAYGAIEARLRTSIRAAHWIVGGINKRFLYLPRPWSRRAPGGGMIVAIVGVDGSGKSTAMTTINAWLGSEIDTIPMYFGTGDGRPSLLLRPFKMMLPFIARTLKTRPKGASHGAISNRDPGFLYSMLLTVWALVVAREKRNKLLAARRGANRGLVILTDRYPQNETACFNDGPLLNRIPHAPQWLRRLEASAYFLAQRLPPDLVIKLQVTPETAQSREPNMDPSTVRERIAALRPLTFAAKHVVTIDAEQPLPSVMRRIKSEIWNLL
jgi:thymidylate kinase